MSKTAATRTGRKRALARLRAIKRRAAAFKRGTRKLLTMMLVAAFVVDGSMVSHAQVGSGMIGGASGQGAMAPVGGLVNSGIARFRELEANGPGWMYWGLNAADRGLGYQGSYMTLGGFIPYAEDDLGGIWSADLRSHLSNYGGFFSNVGLVRKQFFGGAIGGIGVYWDYDGDQNQYADTTITDTSGSYIFAGGQSYSQVGVSGEFLTDYGNLRSNGYIPVGTTAQTMGPFVGNSLLCTPGINAALAGADLEVGAYIPGLSDWAGMVSVGGYTFGNARYNLANGQDVVPFFGGVYTRLDLTLIRNWDFSLQYNNDSYFDSTGFARLTYRMGGSRRRNVPDQMEQPMMRNEHIVRAHQAPEQAINPVTGDPWRVIHVDNSKPTNGPGTAESPTTTLADAQFLADQDNDIVFVHQGNSLNSPYEGGFTFRGNNQYLVGEGTSLQVPTRDCGFIPIWTASGSPSYPVITGRPAGTPDNPTNAAIQLSNGLVSNSTVDHLQITGAPVAISDGPGLPAGGVATVNDVRINGNGASQTGVLIQDLAGAGGTYNFTNMALTNLTADGFVIDGSGAAAPSNPFVNISNTTIKNTSGSAVVVNAIGGSATGDDGRVRLANSSIDGTTGPGVTISGANAIVETTTIKNVGTYGVAVTGNSLNSGTTATGTSTVQVVDSRIIAEIGVQASSSGTNDLVNLTVNQNVLTSPLGGNGINLAVNNGKMNANLVGNTISNRATTALTTGTAGGITSPASVASNIYLTTSNTTSGLNNLTIKAASQDNLVALNRNATVTTAPPFNPTNTGTTSPLVPPPPPPNYDPSAIVPLPTP